MKRKVSTLLFLLFLGISTSVCHIQPVKASGVHADWVVDRLTNGFLPAFSGDIITLDMPFPHIGEVYDLSTGNITSLDMRPHDVDGDLIACSHGPATAHDIAVYNISADTYIPICTNPSDQWEPAIDGKRVVWTDRSASDIYMYDIESQEEIQITNSTAEEDAPDISGDKIVYRKVEKDVWSVCLYDLSNETEIVIATNQTRDCSPVISGDNMVWSDIRNGDRDEYTHTGDGNMDIYMYTISAQKLTPICTDGAKQVYPSISDELIAWGDERDNRAGGEYLNVYAYDLTSNEEIQITYDDEFDQHPHPHSVSNGKIVFSSHGGGIVCIAKPPPVGTPIASFVYSPNDPIINETIIFDASASYDQDGTIVFYEWQFGDGNITKTSNPVISHICQQWWHPVILTIIDDDGMKDTYRTLIPRPQTGNVIISISSRAIMIGENIHINGTVIPTRSGVPVTISYRIMETEDWNVIATVLTNESSNFSYDWIPSQIGLYEIKAHWLDREDYRSHIDVRTGTSIAVSTSPSSKLVEFKVNVSGKLRDIYGNGLSSEMVVLYYTFSGISEWVPIISDITDASGCYSALWIPPATGNFVIKTKWTGNSTHFGVSNTTMLNMLAYDDQYVFSVESNSTISELAFNSTDWTLGFEAIGPDGTTGYARILLAKSLVNDITNLRVYVDGNQKTDFMATLVDDSWLLTFNYKHSIHQILVDLDINIIPEFTSFLLILLCILTFFSATILLTKPHTKFMKV